jgi:hypothetical protein
MPSFNAQTTKKVSRQAAWRVLVCLMIGTAAAYAGAAHAGDGGHGKKGHGVHRQAGGRHSPHAHRPPPPPRAHYRPETRYHAPPKDYRAHGHEGWRYHDGRYWAPANYRGKYCNDRRHHHAVHYHVSYDDYYAYYYPRFHSHVPLVPGASLIISLPLF